jgi:shikimate dehydrogenase
LRRLAVLGHPVAHSRSPAIQNAALAELGLAAEWSYEAIDVAPDELAARLAAMGAEGYAGANVTVPHKRAALELADESSGRARQIGAANTLTFAHGQLLAENTDATGLLRALPASPAGRRALVLGAGGAARAVIWALAREGADVEVWNRTPSRARELAAEFGVTAIEPEGELPGGFELIVNTTTVGMEGGGLAELRLAPASFSSAQTVVDIVYGSGETELLQAARERGATVVDGLEMLVRQGAESLRIWTGREPPLDVMREAARGA